MNEGFDVIDAEQLAPKVNDAEWVASQPGCIWPERVRAVQAVQDATGCYTLHATYTPTKERE